MYMSHIKGGSGFRWLSASTMNDSDDDIDSSDSDDGEESVLDYGTDSSDSDCD